jgi:hypothetical protein
LKYNDTYNTIIPVVVEPESIVNTYIFTVSSKKCKDGIYKYVEDNIDRFKSSEVWDFKHEECMNLYYQHIKDTYSIDAKEFDIDYEIEYRWEIDVT